MSRWVVPTGEGLKSGGGESPSGPAERIAKYIPGEIISAYTMLYGLIVSYNGGVTKEPSPDGYNWVLTVTVLLIFIFLIVTIFYIRKNSDPTSRKAHLIVSPVAYLAWVYPISSALLGSWFNGLVAILLQALSIGLALAIAPKEQKSNL